MSLRSAMVWGGGLLATSGLLLPIIRLIGMHDRLPSLGDLAPVTYYGASIGVLLIGLVMVVAAPQDRRARRRVTLEERPVHEETTLRPAHQGTPTTTGFQRPAAAPDPVKPQAPAPPAAQAMAQTQVQTKPQSGAAALASASGPAATASAASNQQSGRSGGQTEQVSETPHTNGMEAHPRPAWGTPRSGHPNDAVADSPSDGPGGWSDQGSAAAPAPPVRRTPKTLGADEANERVQARRSQLMERIEELEQKANQAKVRFGLGRVSAAGYRQYLAEVDRERMMIESELMETED